VVAANAFSNDAETKIVNGFYSDGWQGLDAGPKSLANFEK
jgi:phosphoglycerate kinase